MAYTLKYIDDDTVKKIVRDFSVDPAKDSVLKSRGGYFNNYKSLACAIDNETGNYLFIAPKYGRAELKNTYYFYFDKNIYEIFRERPSSSVVYILGDASTEKLAEMQNELLGAFSVHGFFGEGNENVESLSFLIAKEEKYVGMIL